MNRVITNTFTLTAVKDNEAVRDNLIHCSLMNKNRMTWWAMPTDGNVRWSTAREGKYMIQGYTGWEWLAKPGMIADLRQIIALSDRNTGSRELSPEDKYVVHAHLPQPRHLPPLRRE